MQRSSTLLQLPSWLSSRFTFQSSVGTPLSIWSITLSVYQAGNFFQPYKGLLMERSVGWSWSVQYLVQALDRWIICQQLQSFSKSSDIIMVQWCCGSVWSLPLCLPNDLEYANCRNQQEMCTLRGIFLFFMCKGLSYVAFHLSLLTQTVTVICK